MRGVGREKVIWSGVRKRCWELAYLIVLLIQLLEDNVLALIAKLVILIPELLQSIAKVNNHLALLEIEREDVVVIDGGFAFALAACFLLLRSHRCLLIIVAVDYKLYAANGPFTLNQT